MKSCSYHDNETMNEINSHAYVEKTLNKMKSCSYHDKETINEINSHSYVMMKNT